MSLQERTEERPTEDARSGRGPAVRLSGIRKAYGDVVAVDHVDLEIAQGEFFTLLGPSGSGKTTTLRLIAGFERPDEGTVELGGRDVSTVPPYARDVNTVFQDYALFPHMTIADNVAYGLRVKGVSRRERQERVQEILRRMRLPDVGVRKPGQLSGGQRQRVALARALVNHPRVLLLDEPLGALDLKLRKQMQLELKRIQHEIGITFVHVTHDQEEAMTMADRIAIMNGGRIEQLGSPSDLYERPATPFVASFLGVSNLLEATVAAGDRVTLADGTQVTVPESALAGRTGKVAIGIRPEKIRADDSEANRLAGTVLESAYIGVSTQYLVDTTAGSVTLYVQNDRPGASAVSPGQRVTLSWNPESTFVVDHTEAPE